MKKLKILYYSNALIAKHGGRLHSEAFVKEASRSELVQKIYTYPSPEKNELTQEIGTQGFRESLKRNSLLQVLFFYRRNKKSINEILKVLKRQKDEIDVLHIRL